ncbi:type II toxin-antitoxin system Phd/YefM family antitoxin [Rhizobium sp. RAF56]|uniref:type II toxin-antitoxin system Phd/YefM family antitoxin n=1 Tax=Rhizobium sp. RAF56 TaxID=3233062 RepID=UPI003F971CE7
MAHVGFTEFRQNLASHLDAVIDSRAPLFVTRNKQKAVVVISEEEYESMQETLHLMSNPVNAQLLRESIAEMEAGGAVDHDIVERKP